MLAKATPVLPAEDIARAKRFYQEQLGLSVLVEGDAGIAFQCADGSRLFIYPHGRTPATHTAATFFVDDLHREVDDLRRRGITFKDYDFPGLKTVNGIADLGIELSAWFEDTEGNMLAISQLK